MTLQLLDAARTPQTVSHQIIKNLEKHQIELSWNQSPSVSKLDFKEQILNNDVGILAGPLCLEVSQFVKHRSVGSHFLKYTDFIENRQGQLWGASLFSEVFLDCLLGAVQNQDYKGSVIFLGESSHSLPTLEILAKFGFEDFVFLNTKEGAGIAERAMPGFFGVKLSEVDSTAFIQSQKEYSFCFVMEDQFSQQVIDDMSYFHFLSSKSIVFDLSGRSNFMFEDVKALGVDVVEHSQISRIWTQKLCDRLHQFAQKKS